MGVMFCTDGAGFTIMIPVVIYAASTKKSELLFFSIMLCGLSIITNNFFMPRNVVFFIVQRIIMVVTGAVFMMKAMTVRNSRCLTPLVGIMVYLIFSMIASMFGWNPLISELKIILFVCSFYAFYGVANDLLLSARSENISGLRSIMLAVAIFYILGSLLVIPFPEISQLSGHEITEDTISLFKGMTTHSQCLGPVAATLSIILFGDMIFSIRKMDWLYILLLIICPYLIYKTSSRTGMASYFIGMGLLGLFFIHARQTSQKWKSKVTTIMIGGVSLLAIAALSSSTIREEITRFIMKQRVNQSDSAIEFSTEGMVATRQFLIDRALDNFKNSPMVGNGFQVSPEMGQSAAGNSELARILSAPIEKGVWIYAVLEEGGAIGMFIFCTFCIVCFIQLARRKAYIAASLFVFMLTSNMAEFSMFSMSYTGGFIWAMVFVGATFDAIRNRKFAQDALYYNQQGRWM